MSEFEVMAKKQEQIENLQKEVMMYKKGYHILMDYFDSISDEEKPIVDRELKAVGL